MSVGLVVGYTVRRSVSCDRPERGDLVETSDCLPAQRGSAVARRIYLRAPQGPIMCANRWLVCTS